MEKTQSVLKSENGSALFVTMMILLIATMIGYFATQNTSIELQIASNQRVYQRGFYRADAAAMEGAQRLENLKLSSPQSLRNAIYPVWMYPKSQTANLQDLNQWDANNDGILDQGAFSDIDPTDPNDPNPAFAIAYQGIAPGAQTRINTPTMRMVAIFSIYNPPTPEQLFLTTGYLIEY